ncbi:MAG: hypothetical protein R3C44_00730 [Chloroflexota bacterium]
MAEARLLRAAFLAAMKTSICNMSRLRRRALRTTRHPTGKCPGVDFGGNALDITVIAAWVGGMQCWRPEVFLLPVRCV